MIEGGWNYFSGRNVLLLQGPVGPFFRKLAKVLTHAGAGAVHTINFNGGDWLFSPAGSIDYTGRDEDWPTFLERTLAELRIDAILLFGDCRTFHIAARNVARRHGIELWAFEEGYVRPNFVTMERGGTNGNSVLPKRPESYRGAPESRSMAECAVGNVFWYLALWGSLYFLAAAVGRPFFRHYNHHRRLSVAEGCVWLKAGWRKLLYRVKERGLLGYLVAQKNKEFFLVSLQTAIDSQIRVHSRFRSMEAFIEEVIVSFSRFCHGQYVLVLKHHPLDRGHHNYAEFIRRIARDAGVMDRVLYIHDQHLPTLLQNAAGLIVVNSTVGLSGIHHGLPVKALGSAIYDLEGLAFQGDLDSFWDGAARFRPDMSLYRRFRTYVIEHTQLNGSFYSGWPAQVARSTDSGLSRGDVWQDVAAESDGGSAEENEATQLEVG